MATIKFLLKNKANSKGQFPIVLRITRNRKSKMISLGYYCDKKDWNTSNSQFKKSYPNHIQRNRLLAKNNEKALKIIDDFQIENYDFNLDEFEAKFRGQTYSNICVWDFWKETINDQIKGGKIGNAKAYKTTYNSFYKFCEGKKISFRNITPYLLEKYITYLRENGNKDGGIGFKLRELRAIYNKAIKHGVVSQKYYPFKNIQVAKFKNKNEKKALTREQVRSIENFDIENYPNLADTHRYFVFSYYSGGMNWRDMIQLKWENIISDRIFYTRSKTNQNFNIPVLEPLEKILKHYKKNNNSSNYIFPILLNNNMSPSQIENRSKKTRKKFNKQLKEIAQLLGIEENITSYVIRHSFATNLKYAGVSTDVISETMGHKDVSTTNAYLKDFGSEIKDDAMKKLLD